MMNQHPGLYIREKILPESMSVSEAAERLEIGRPALSRMLNGKAALSAELAEKIEALFGASAERLLKMQAAHDAEHVKTASDKITAAPYSPVHLEVLEREISAWATNRIDARTRLPVLIRTLVHSTSRNVNAIDFPGNDSGERAGWDGYLEVAGATPWTPAGKSGWEFGCNKSIKSKADGDYEARVKSVAANERREMTFLFVTPHRWSGKTDWIKARNKENEWKEVRALDASDLEQWIQQSVSAQAWFAHETGRPTEGAKSLSEVWVEWVADSAPELPVQLFDQAIAMHETQIIHWAKKEDHTPLVIAADSVIEGLAFVKAAFDSIADEHLVGYSDRALVFTQADTLTSLLTVNSRIIPIIWAPDVERSFSPFANNLKSILIYPKNTTTRDPDISIDPLNYEAFRLGLEAIDCSRDEIDRLSNESGRSLTVLRRRLSQLDAVKRPEWTTDAVLSRSLCCFTLAGAWDSRNKTDRDLVSLLASADDYSELEPGFGRLLQLDDAPVWSLGGIRGVVSKIDALYAVCGSFTAADLERFFDCCELVLSEDDPALDLPREERWAASIHGKTREISGVLRNAIAEMAVLLAVHGDSLFKALTGVDVSARADRLVRNLLAPLTARKLEANNHDLQHYAEIAPGTFLEIVEEDLQLGDHSICLQVIRPENTGIFGGGYARTGLLWALEGLAWPSNRLTRVVHILGTLSRKKLEDNLANKPINSLLSIFRSWMPQTSADLDQRKASFDYLKRNFPDIGWIIATNQFDPRSTVGDYSHKPKWRNDGHGYGEPVTRGESSEFVLHCLDACLCWPQFDREKLADLVDSADGLLPEHQTKVWGSIKTWSQTASEADKAWLREKVRMNAYTRRAAIRAKRNDGDLFEPTEVAEAFDALRPDDVILEHEWLFRNQWVEMNQEDLEDAAQDYEARETKIKEQRIEALKVIHAQKGLEGVFQMIELSGTKSLIGQLMVSVLDETVATLDFLYQAIERPTLSDSDRENVFRGILSSLSEAMLGDVFDLAENKLPATTRAQIFREAPFNPSTWARVASSRLLEAEYWSSVPAAYLWVHPDHVAEAVSKLLEYNRPYAALSLSGPRMERVPHRRLLEMLDKLTGSEEHDQNIDNMGQYYITEAFKRLNADKSISRNELARLEFRYLQLLERTEYDIPNLENEVASNPSMFVEAVAYLYKRSDDGVDPDWLQGDQEVIQKRGSSMFHFFQALSRLPGRNARGEVEPDRLIEWINKVREGCRELARLEAAELKIGELLAKSQIGGDGVWPSEPVRDALQATATKSMKSGFRTGKYNLRGVVMRGTGGDQERELEAQYRHWAEALHNSHPVVAAVLTEMADGYRHEAEYHDTETKVRGRLPY